MAESRDELLLLSGLSAVLLLLGHALRVLLLRRRLLLRQLLHGSARRAREWGL